VLALLTWLALGLDFALSLQFPQAAILWKRTSVFFIGIAFMLAGTALRFYSMAVLGRFFTYYVAVRDKQTVVEVGPYHYIRHPSYTGALMIFIGMGLALGSWAGLLALLTCVGIAYAYRISVEESVLAAALGEPYQQYMRRTRRLVPFLF
jgi:protein-S-isoprenylcysteine O-methyltransferase Ste14